MIDSATAFRDSFKASWKTNRSLQTSFTLFDCTWCTEDDIHKAHKTEGRPYIVYTLSDQNTKESGCNSGGCIEGNWRFVVIDQLVATEGFPVTNQPFTKEEPTACISNYVVFSSRGWNHICSRGIQELQIAHPSTDDLLAEVACANRLCKGECKCLAIKHEQPIQQDRRNIQAWTKNRSHLYHDQLSDQLTDIVFFQGHQNVKIQKTWAWRPIWWGDVVMWVYCCINCYSALVWTLVQHRGAWHLHSNPGSPDLYDTNNSAPSWNTMWSLGSLPLPTYSRGCLKRRHIVAIFGDVDFTVWGAKRNDELHLWLTNEIKP